MHQSLGMLTLTPVILAWDSLYNSYPSVHTWASAVNPHSRDSDHDLHQLLRDRCIP